MLALRTRHLMSLLHRSEIQVVACRVVCGVDSFASKHGVPRYDGTRRYQALSVQRSHHGMPQGSQQLARVFQPCRMLRWRAASSNSEEPLSGDLSLSEAAPGVQRQEGEPRPSCTASVDGADGAAGASDISTDGGESASADALLVASADGGPDGTADGATLDSETATGGRETYTEAIAEWFWSKKDELAQFMAVPAVKVFGREFKMDRLSLTDTVDFRERVKEVLNFRIWPSSGDDDALEGASKSVGEAGLEGMGVRPDHPAAAALREGGHAELSFGFSAGGLLFPYYIGVIFRLHELGVVTSETKIGGASAGSLIAACYHSGLSEQTITDACFVLCNDCRVGGTRGRLRSVLQTFLEDLLPDDIHVRCSGKAHVAVTEVFPRPRGLIVSEFTSKEDFISALLTSCHVPWWFDSSVWTAFRGRASYDGGLTNFIPLPPTLHGVRVCCFPAGRVSGVYKIEISPDSFESWPYSMNQMVSWAFEPAEEESLRMYIAKGRADAQAWAEATGVLDVLKDKSTGAMTPTNMAPAA